MEEFMAATSHVSQSVARMNCPLLVGPAQQRSRGGREGPAAQRPSSRPSTHDESSTLPSSSVRCLTCGTILAEAADATHIDGHHHYSFINPHGFMYRIRCYAAARNISLRGTPSSEFAWFPGYTWTTIECAVCSTHVGWRFDGTTSTFFALIAESIRTDDNPAAS